MKNRMLQSTVSNTFIVIICISVLLLFSGCKSKNIPEDPTTDTTISTEYDIPRRDAEKYYKDNSEVLSVEDAIQSKNVQTESEVVEEMAERGFTQYAISSNYSMDGSYSDAVKIGDDGMEKHPMYVTYYYTETGNLWTIYMINGSTMAYPVFLNLQSELGVQVILSESNSVMSYDGTTNKFYETIPNESELLVVQVNTINAEMLEELTVEEIYSYVTEK